MKSPVTQFLLSRIFWKNVLIAIGITIVLIILVQISLYFYTGHRTKVRVPDFTGMSLQQVGRICAQKKLLWIVQDSTFLAESPRGAVLDQYPEPGSGIKKNRKIFLITNSWFPQMIKMPKAFDMPYRQAEAVLKSAGLHVSNIEYIPHLAPTYVLEQKFEGRLIAEGTDIQKGSGITLIVGAGLSDERAAVPYLLGISRDLARIIALNNYFNLGAIRYDSTVTNSRDSALAKVYKQFPNYSNQARLGFSIDIWLTCDSVLINLLDSTRLMNESVQDDTTQIQ
ncbi:MAG: PASTA domain-containing protein [Bacteroidales bacterium]|jgi:beta-lactam-binding protein with PASTA domain